MDNLFNQSLVADNHRTYTHVENIASNNVREIITVVNYVVLCGIISVLGSITNGVNLIIFYKQGLDTTINISFFALAISDLCSLIMQQCYNVFVNPWFEDLGVPSVSSGIQFIVAGVPRECFARITCLITVYVTAERCFCITFPLRVKRMITARSTAVTMFAIYSSIVVSFVPFYCTTYIETKCYPERNITFLGLAFSSNNAVVDGIVLFIHAISGTLSFLAVVLFTIILIKKLRQKNSWRQTASGDQKQNEAMSNRDRKTVTMVVLIATILIVSYTPSVLLFLWTFFEPEFSIAGKYSNLFTAGWSFACLFECINSSVNILLYYKMSTKFRETFRQLFFKR